MLYSLIGDRRGCMSLVRVRKSKFYIYVLMSSHNTRIIVPAVSVFLMFFNMMCTHIKYRRGPGVQPARTARSSAAPGRAGARAARARGRAVAGGRRPVPSGRLVAARRRSARLPYYMSKYARTRARCTCTAAAHTSDSPSSVPVPALARDAGAPLARSAWRLEPGPAGAPRAVIAAPSPLPVGPPPCAMLLVRSLERL
jgi:hypothetical protein